MLRQVDDEIRGKRSRCRATVFIRVYGQSDGINYLVVIDVCGGVVVAGEAIAKVPLERVCGGVDVGQESHVFFCAVGKAFIGFDTDVVDGDAGAEVDGVGSYHVSIATGIAESVNVGVDAVCTGQVMHAVADFFSKERVFRGTVHRLKL